MHGLILSLTGSWTEAYLTKGASADQYAGDPTLGLTGNTIPEVPHFAGNFAARYTHPLGADLSATLGADISYRGQEDAYFASNAYNLPLHSYFLTNLRAGLDRDAWNITAFVRNVSNRRAQVSLVNNSSTQYGLVTVRPRTVGLSVTRKF
jgi:hypothetical protein